MEISCHKVEVNLATHSFADNTGFKTVASVCMSCSSTMIHKVYFFIPYEANKSEKTKSVCMSCSSTMIHKVYFFIPYEANKSVHETHPEIFYHSVSSSTVLHIKNRVVSYSSTNK